jgi:hypothetical protein
VIGNIGFVCREDFLGNSKPENGDGVVVEGCEADFAESDVDVGKFRTVPDFFKLRKNDRIIRGTTNNRRSS